jgi:hypothetical protein
MNRCETCAHYFPARIYSAVNPKTGKRHLEHVYDYGGCERFKCRMIEIEGKLDEIECPMPQAGGHGEGETGGAVVVGKNFGCIHHRPKSSESKTGWTEGGEA